MTKILVGVSAAALSLAPAAAAEVPRSLSAPESCYEYVEASLDFWRCDDGRPEAGGLRANGSGAKAATVPARYRGYRGLPAKAADAAEMPGADADGDVALDVDITLPRSKPPRGGYPMLFFMHGCCGGSKRDWHTEELYRRSERWHYSDSWFASRGYLVVTFTSRGFVNGEGEGSTGEMQLMSRSYEINDYQHLACQVAGAAGRWSAITDRKVRINPRRVVTTGGSYGGGFTWLTVTDPRWRCGSGTGASGTRMRLAAAAPRYGWTDLVYSLAPTGTHSVRPGRLPRFDGCDSGPVTLTGDPCQGGAGTPIGPVKQSILAGLYASGKVGFGVSANQPQPHTTFPPTFDETYRCINASLPPLPGCERTVTDQLASLLRESSAYYQNDFFRRLRHSKRWRVPVFSAATFTDPLFPPAEHLRMENRLRAADPGYPIQTYSGDYQHFTQNKATEWADVCGADLHICTDDDYARDGARARDFNRPPATVRRIGITTMLDRFLDHYARPAVNRREPRPRFGSTASLQTCPQNATARRPLDQPGRRYRAPSFAAQARQVLNLELTGGGTTTSLVLPNLHAAAADPIANELLNDRACAHAEGPAGSGVVVAESERLDRAAVMIGAATVDLLAAGAANAAQLGIYLAARLYDVGPDGTTALVDRGHLRLADGGRVRFELHGNGWRFERGHRLRLELAQDDAPYLQRATPPSALTLTDISLRLPVR